ncbi:hypothetical protein GMST_33600 [Geomonas silvestris]|uniref:Uncharacterized protein n=1 Tax=Geomonas silvestris TaxID=2740184 RepID=A0A6V8MLW5_9BACT|nr:hypothetical protein [Geomonas silvestris]GFO61035.1 hypothetical protein GMST_33600 [Geomonas silvestris]
MRVGQVPGRGCARCGAFAGKPLEVQRSHLRMDDGNWLCEDCLDEKLDREELDDLDELDDV